MMSNQQPTATETVLAFLAQPEIALGSADEMELLLADSQLLRAACEAQLDKVTALDASERDAVRAAFPDADWSRIADELQSRTRNADNFFETP